MRNERPLSLPLNGSGDAPPTPSTPGMARNSAAAADEDALFGLVAVGDARDHLIQHEKALWSTRDSSPED
jgi:hypothetical protein